MQTDPVRELLTRNGLEEEARERHVLNVDNVTMDNVGLQKLLVSAVRDDDCACVGEKLRQ